MGITGQDPKSLQFYYDSTTSAVVIAAKGIASGQNTGTGTPVATVFAYGSSTGWQKTTDSFYYAGPVTALGGLSGNFNETITTKTNSLPSDTTNVIAWGTSSGVYVIFKAKVKNVVKPA
ncbi:MAG: hypothetical protein QM796_03400 [Chthoniobacteraceae bacterium]